MTTTVKWQMGEQPGKLEPIEDTVRSTRVEVLPLHKPDIPHVDTKPLVAALKELDFNLQKSIDKVCHARDDGIIPGPIAPSTIPPITATGNFDRNYERKDQVGN